MPSEGKSARIIDGLREQSRSYAEKATRLSNLLEQAENFFCEMPGKTEVRTSSPDDEYVLSFCKTHQGWRLFLESRDDSQNETAIVTQANIRKKAEAAKRLPELYKQLQSHIADLHAVMDRGLESIKGLPFLDFELAEKNKSEFRDQFVEEEDPNALPF